MSFVDMEITRRQFAARYENLGRVMLANLADMYGVTFDQAEHWADQIDREAEIAAVRPPVAAGGGIEGVASPFCATPSTPSNSAVLQTRGAPPAEAGCTAASALSSHPAVPAFEPSGSRGGPGAVPTLSRGAAPGDPSPS